MLSSKLFEEATLSQRFRIRPLTENVIERCRADQLSNQLILDLQKAFSENEIKQIIERLIRNVFLIEPVNKEVTSTKYTYRWLAEENDFFDFSVNDPRGATYEECEDIFFDLIKKLRDNTENQDSISVLKGFIDHRQTAYELPIDYLDTGGQSKHIHRLNNLSWLFTESSKTVLLRKSLKELQGSIKYLVTDISGREVEHEAPLSQIMNNILSNKIEIKTYKTDRAQTGRYQTNREKRWEAHPLSVQFSTRKSGWGIEYVLMSQAINFEGFPTDIREKFQNEGISEAYTERARCPITRDFHKFTEFASEVMSPVHGRSGYQVGHLNPLKLTTNRDLAWGHTPENIAWISADGNRIQGSLSYQDTVDLLHKIWKNHGFGEHISSLA